MAREQSQPLRNLFMAMLKQFSAAQLVFMDETHCNPEALRRKYGYAIHGWPAFLKIYNTAHGDSNAVSGIAALASDGILSFRIVSENVNNELFIETLRNDVLPLMNPFPAPKSVLILDNAPTHNATEIYQLCQQFHVLVFFLPPYSYDLNPIELSFHQAKEFIRRKYRTAHGNIADKLAEWLNQVTTDFATAYFEHCGYNV